MFFGKKTDRTQRFDKKIVFVSGGTDGIGLATASAFADEGATVIVTGRNEVRGEEARKKISESNESTVLYLKADVSDATAVAGVFDEIASRFKRLDVAFNNAGVMQTRDKCVDIEESDWDRVIATNIKGTWLCMKNAIPLMRKSGGGVMVNMGSTASVIGMAEYSCYATSKHAIIGLTKSSALECIGDNIRINAICPGYVETEMTKGVSEERLQQRVPAGRVASIEEIASAVLWLSSEESAYLVGTGLVIDGGVVAG